MPKRFSTNQIQHMRRALQLARRGAGLVAPNPAVGCVVVRNGEVVGEGYHRYRTRSHAEVLAIQNAGPSASGSDLFVNLEPCAHQGRTPPCVSRILEAGISRAFVSIEDPDPRVSGRGILGLQEGGIDVVTGLLEKEAREVNRAYFHARTTGRPFVTLKLALTLDGKIATRTGDARWITGERARRFGHRLRFLADAILVGSGTLLQDDPSLDVRWRRRNGILKVVLDSRLRTPPQARLFESGDPVLLFHADGAPVPATGYSGDVELCAVASRNDRLDWIPMLSALTERGVQSLLVEGGSRVAASALQSGVVDRMNLIYGPAVVGGRDLSGFSGPGVERLSEAWRFRIVSTRRLDEDLLVDLFPRREN